MASREIEIVAPAAEKPIKADCRAKWWKWHRKLISAVFVIVHILGGFSSLAALMTIRTSQGTIACMSEGLMTEIDSGDIEIVAPAAEKPTKSDRRAKWRNWRRKAVSALFVLAHIMGVFSSFDALMTTRTSQGTIAWIMALNTVPIVSVPAYWVFGRMKFQGYLIEREKIHAAFASQSGEVQKEVRKYMLENRDRENGSGVFAVENLAELPFLKKNSVELLIDGEETFESILNGIDEAEEYILVQFYIVRNDELGNRLKDKLIEKASEGVDVWFLYDEIGTRRINAYWQELRSAGVNVNSFHSTRGPKNRFQLNFRNHRKIVVVDGKTGWVGGHNVGDEYLGLDPDYGWRDTHIKLAGPAVLELQLSFAEDWRWATDELLTLTWFPVPVEDGEATALILPTGPADRLETCSLMYQQVIHSSRERIWITSPYFVPDEGVISSLHLAALRGVDVRIIIPETSDSLLTQYSPYAFLGELIESGIEIYRYQPGFLHQKVFLMDDKLAGVGTANFDNRSFRLNFEVTALIHEKEFLVEMEEMFENDFAVSRKMTSEGIAGKPAWFRALSRLSYLTAPIQ